MGVVLVVFSNLEDEHVIRKLQTYINYLVEDEFEEYVPTLLIHLKVTHIGLKGGRSKQAKSLDWMP